ncbi:PulJ/GspJ family protein [Bacillus weihaiensis]|uniref:Prepilin-type N-terminal cleavage/methylation domain-containing protein n=1 Tax=Bacillus weihaiensis TaxID=1547283 RepID=A0A1L3MPQ4_9BACI|nr:prepilin-type N-terminal cleavage/methylation domain-containing protein [Bacillus weihaiensis]APH04214.1 hypothetical protein A9C19_05365 [Bacillus weihaiensis]
MKNIVKKLNNEQGVSLLEVMATVVISSIILVVFYNVFTMGVKTYERVGVEMQLRDEADYIVSAIMKELYETPINSVRECDGVDHCIEIVQNIVYEKNENFSTLIDQKTLDESDEIVTTIIFTPNAVTLTKKEGQNPETTSNLLNNNYQLLFNNEERTKVNLECLDKSNQCEQGLIEMQLKLEHRKFTDGQMISVDPIVLTSKFGF